MLPAPTPVACALEQLVSVPIRSGFRNCMRMCSVMLVKHFEFSIINFLSSIQNTRLLGFVFPLLLSELSALKKMDVGEMTH